MASLRDRLAGLSNARVAPSWVGSPPLSSVAARRKTGVAVLEHVLPLEARRWLPQLPAADPGGIRLISNLKFKIPSASEWLFLDIETTGLAGGTGTYAFLVGLGKLAPDGFHLRQYFLRDLAAERELLAALAPELETAPLLVTYNGKLFDAPLLETRYRLARMRWPLEERPHLDLVYPARRLWKPRCGSARLLELEQQVLRHQRGEDVPGELIPQLYFEYLRNGDDRPLQVVFAHNAEDLLTLAALAARLLSLATAPEAQSEESIERVGLARLFERARDFERAGSLYEMALQDHLPAELHSLAQLRLSFLYKRRRDYERATALWHRLANSDNATALTALEQLAICYEHRLREPEKAAESTRRALHVHHSVLAAERKGQRARLARRLQRLTRKLPNLYAGTDAPTELLCGNRFRAEGP